MEILIILSLITIIILLVIDKFQLSKNLNQRPERDVSGKNRSGPTRDIKSEDRQLVPKSTTNIHREIVQISERNLVVEDTKIQPGIQPFNKEGASIVEDESDWIEDEEEWQKNIASSDDISLAQGVSFEELSTVGALLQNDHWDHRQKETTAAIVRKLHGTELFNLLEISTQSAAQKIAMLLENALSEESKNNASTLVKDDWDDFDIGEFI
ncbi:conjugal transfer protein TraD [Chryseobacterium indologenes]|uniref:conjugal transfer protein TraD n=1 Tax=Chryseobacterium indologenes TaxID=253 RepID=UPI0023E778A1|nr:conjugal transfer protein TraD [Chryseobacterium indologenes]WET50745.1 conjugal transfer protein TraD [Chryseobacterium indologenes]